MDIENHFLDYTRGKHMTKEPSTYEVQQLRYKRSVERWKWFGGLSLDDFITLANRTSCKTSPKERERK